MYLAKLAYSIIFANLKEIEIVSWQRKIMTCDALKKMNKW